jgi:orotidine-5'-phosphate decarboxylase
VRRIFGTGRHAVLPAVSREVLAAGPDPAALSAASRTLRDRFAFLRA